VKKSNPGHPWGKDQLEPEGERGRHDSAETKLSLSTNSGTKSRKCQRIFWPRPPGEGGGGGAKRAYLHPTSSRLRLEEKVHRKEGKEKEVGHPVKRKWTRTAGKPIRCSRSEKLVIGVSMRTKKQAEGFGLRGKKLMTGRISTGQGEPTPWVSWKHSPVLGTQKGGKEQMEISEKTSDGGGEGGRGEKTADSLQKTFGFRGPPPKQNRDRRRGVCDL